MSVPFVHLRVHSDYSLVDGLIKCRALAQRAAEKSMPAIALTDRSNLFGLVKFYQACLNHGVKPIVGADLWLLGDDGNSYRVTLLATNRTGYGNLIKLVSGAYVGTKDRGFVERQVVFQHSDGLIVLGGATHSDVSGAIARGEINQAERLVDQWREVFGDRYYLEIMRTGRAGEDVYIAAAVDLSARLDLPLVATNEVCFLAEEDFEAHETRVCIHDSRVLDDPRRERRHSSAQYLRSTDEMLNLFRDIPEACSNTVEIAKRCNLDLNFGEYYLPNYPVKDGTTLESFLELCSRKGLKQRLLENPERLEQFSSKEYQDRLDYELGVINQMGFPGYFLIVMEFIAWAKENSIPVGPGRGSGAGSLVAYVLGITDLDPLEYDLLFERFLNPERVSMPDFDVDFCMEGRDRVIQHVSERYGHDAVSQIITFGTMAAKAVVRDVARVQGKPYGLADKLSKLIPFEVGMTLTKAVEETSELADFITQNEEVGEIMDMAYKLEGTIRNVGRHAGGVVIAPSALTDFVPLYVDDMSGGLVSQYDKDDVEVAGLVKFDFLGLKTLTVIDWAVEAINEQLGEGAAKLDIKQIPLNDPATFELLRRAETTGVFQLESRGMKDLIRRLLPDGIDDIIALVALFRPGPLQSGAVDDFINRKHGRAKVEYPHPTLETVLDGTYGVILYQEQVMQIAQVLAGFSLGQADLLRRAMGKKKPEEMAKVREQFVSGASDNQIDTKLTSDIFDLMEKFAGYAFNKSHSATYALVSFQTAWLKTHYPAQFMAATLSAEMQNTDKVVILVDETRRMAVELAPPSVNQSIFRFSAVEDRILYGLGAVRGVGQGPVEALIEARTTQGPFVDLADFCARVDSRKANKRVLEALIRSGAMDELLPGVAEIDEIRATLMAQLPSAMKGAEQAARDQAIGMADMFGGVSTPVAVQVQKTCRLSKKQRLNDEREALGLYLTGHPIDAYLEEIGRFAKCRITDLRTGKQNQLVAGLVVSARTMRSKRGRQMGFVVIDDRSARIEASMFADVFESQFSKVAKDALMVIDGEVQADEFNGGAPRLRVEKLYTLEEARVRFSRGVEIDLVGQATTQNASETDAPKDRTACAESLGDITLRLKRCLEPYRQGHQGCPVAVLVEKEDAQARIALGPQWLVQPSDDLISQLRTEFGEERISLTYR